jgi:hypothetical protein
VAHKLELASSGKLQVHTGQFENFASIGSPAIFAFYLQLPRMDWPS